MTQTGAAGLEDRYGRRRGRRIDRRLAWIIVGVLLAIGAWVLVFGTWRTSANLEFRDLAYSTVDERTVHVDFEVTAPEGSEVVCAIEALSASHAQVGWRILELPANDQRTRRFSETLVTTSPATTGYVKNCWYA